MTPQARQRQRVRAPVLAVTAGAWMVVVFLVLAGGGGTTALAAAGSAGSGPRSVVDLSHQHDPTLAGHAGHAASPAAVLLGWAAMLVAMMGPLLIPALRHVVERSLPSRRARAVTLLLMGYLAVWLAGLLTLAGASTLVRSVLDGPSAATVAGLAVMLAWQVSPAKQRSLNRCHARPPLAPMGRGADLDALRFGLAQAGWCFGSCWALMLLPLLLPGHHLTAMLVVSLWLWAERFESPRAPGWRVRLPSTTFRIALARIPGLRVPVAPATSPPA